LLFSEDVNKSLLEMAHKFRMAIGLLYSRMMPQSQRPEAERAVTSRMPCALWPSGAVESSGQSSGQSVSRVLLNIQSCVCCASCNCAYIGSGGRVSSEPTKV